MRGILNFLGWIMLLVALAVGAKDAFDFLDHGGHPLITIGGLWQQYAPGSLAGFRQGLLSLPLPDFWDGLIGKLFLNLPALLVTAALAVLLLLAARVGRVEDSASSRRARRRRASRLG